MLWLWTYKVSIVLLCTLSNGEQVEFERYIRTKSPKKVVMYLNRMNKIKECEILEIDIQKK